jgi:5-methylcytosine-specific restriction endonuclease McrA
MKKDILKLTAGFFPCGVSNWKTAMTDIVSGAAYPIDMNYELSETGDIDKNKIEYMNVIRDFAEWKTLPIREFDEYVSTPKHTYRLPDVIVCATFNRIIFKRVVFPTKSNIWQRDNFTCQYSGKKLTRDNLSIDHILPSSRGGGNTWENLVTCDKALNVWKSDRTPKECGLKLSSKPVKPKNGMVFNFMRDEWKMFIDGGQASFGDD